MTAFNVSYQGEATKGSISIQKELFSKLRIILNGNIRLLTMNKVFFIPVSVFCVILWVLEKTMLCICVVYLCGLSVSFEY